MAPDNDPVQIPQIDSANFPEGLPELEQSPRNLTGRERRRRWWILAILLLLLALLSYGTYYWVHNRSLPTVRLGGITGAVQPPQYLYSIAGKGITAMDRPVGVGVAADGRVYVVDFGNRRISVFTNDGRYLFSFSKIGGGVLKNPVHLIVRGDEVWVSDRRLRQLIVFDLQGNYKRTFEPKNEVLDWTPLAFNFAPDGSLRVTDVGGTDTHSVVFFSVDGSRTVTVGKTAQITALEQAPAEFMFPNGVAVAKNGDVYISDGDNRRVQILNSKGEFKAFVNTSGVPRGIAIDAKDRLYVADALAHTIDVYDLKGAEITQFGTRGFGPGQFNFPNDVALDTKGKIFITDRENDQVQVWGWPTAVLPALPKPGFNWWTLAGCLSPLLLLPLLLLRRKVRIIVTEEFVSSLAEAGEIKAVRDRKHLVLVAPTEDRPLYEGREAEGIALTELLTFEDHSESDTNALVDKLKIGHREAMLLAMSERARALGTNDRQLRWLAVLAEVRSVNLEEFREIFLGRERAAGVSDR
jgi:DNA-binding beta-propeller fold protein YncE